MWAKSSIAIFSFQDKEAQRQNIEANRVALMDTRVLGSLNICSIFKKHVSDIPDIIFVESVGQYQYGQHYPFLPIDGSGHLDMAGLGSQNESHFNDLSRYIDQLSIKIVADPDFCCQQDKDVFFLLR